tara:strand:- start:12 stop:2003 length:1992 start_codon:yes stop_codon:yes gene_type:complete
MTIERKVGMGIAGQPSGGPTDVADVFSTHLYTGTASALTITNGIDLAGEGGLVWLKGRGAADEHALIDTERGDNKALSSSSSATEASETGFGSFLSDGFSFVNGGAWYNIQQNNRTYASWTFRKKEKFFDIQTYNGTGSAGLSVAHDLGVIPAFMIVKAYDGSGLSGTGNWYVWTNQINFGNNYAHLNLNGAWESDAKNIFGNGSSFVHPTDTHFTIGGYSDINYASGSNYKKYIAYLFASNDSEDLEDQMIKSSSYTGNGSATGPIINLGWEPQFILIKRADSTGDWNIFDYQRNISFGTNDQYLLANSNELENTYPFINLTPTGFQIKSSSSEVNATSNQYVFLAIRAPMMIKPSAATECFYPALFTGSNSTTQVLPTGFSADLMMGGGTSSGAMEVYHRSHQEDVEVYKLRLSNNNAQTYSGDGNIGAGLFGNSTVTLRAGYNLNYNGGDFLQYIFKRARGFFDIVNYTGTSVARTIPHSLGVVPDFMVVKCRDATGGWQTYNRFSGNTKYQYLNQNYGSQSSSAVWNNTTPTDAVFSVGNGGEVNGGGSTYVAWLFGSVDGVSNFGSYTGTGAQNNIDCGFSAGARFVMIKRIDGNSDWKLFDTNRGIVTGNDSALKFNAVEAANTATDHIDPYASGFSMSSDGELNGTSKTYMYWAIA